MDDMMLKCPYCDDKLSNPEELRAHRFTKHRDVLDAKLDSCWEYRVGYSSGH